MDTGVVAAETQLWGLCTGCDQWFSSPTRSGTVAALGCPECARAPALAEARCSHPREETDGVFSEGWLG